jgi:hypothetical protein
VIRGAMALVVLLAWAVLCAKGRGSVPWYLLTGADVLVLLAFARLLIGGRRV